MFPYMPANIPPQSAWAETNTSSTAKNTKNVISAGLSARPGTDSKNPIPACLSSAICAKDEDQPLCVKWCLAEALIVEEREEEVEETAENGRC